MDLTTFAANNDYKTVVIIDDELSLLNKDMKVSNFLKIREDFKQCVLEDYNEEDLDSLSMGDLKQTIIDDITTSLNLERFVLAVNEMKKANLNVIVVDNYYDELEKYENAIWVVDKELNPHSGLRDKKHIQCAFSTFRRNRTKGKNDIFLIYTADANGLQGYDQTIDFINKYEIFDINDDIGVLYFNVTPKIENLGVEVFKTISDKAIEADYFDKLNESIKKSVNKVQRSLWKNKDFSKIMNYNCFMEGITNDKNLFGITMNSIENDFHVLEEKSDLLNVFKKLNAIESEFDTNGTDIEFIKTRTLHELRRIASSELVNSRVNELGYDVSFGDIFCINNSHYVVVSQQCDITIRNDNCRKLPFFKLIPVELKINENSSLLANQLKLFKKRYKEVLGLKENILAVCEYLDSARKNGDLDFDIGNINDIVNNVHSISNNSLKKMDEDDFGLTNLHIRMGGSYYSIDINKKERELIVDDYLLDVISHSGNKGLSIDSTTKPIISRIVTKTIIDKAFEKVLSDDKIDERLKIIYGVDRTGWKRIGNLSTHLTNLLFREFIEYQTREALLSFETV